MKISKGILKSSHFILPGTGYQKVIIIFILRNENQSPEKVNRLPKVREVASYTGPTKVLPALNL